VSVFVALRKILGEDPDVDAACDGRIYPRVPQTPTLPCIVLQKISGPQDSLVDLANDRWQVTAWAESYGDGEDLGDKILYCLQRYRGVIAEVTIEQITFLSGRPIYDPETGRETFPADYRVKYWRE